jgi:hypothetical protein
MERFMQSLIRALTKGQPKESVMSQRKVKFYNGSSPDSDFVEFSVGAKVSASTVIDVLRAQGLLPSELKSQVSDSDAKAFVIVTSLGQGSLQYNLVTVD